MTEGQLCTLPMSRLMRCPIQLRTVRKETMEYIMLRDSIRDVGLLMPLLARPSKAVEGTFEVVDGSNRYECCTDLDHEEVPCVIRDLSDAEVRRLQVIANSNNIVTKPVDYIRRLQKMVNTGEMSIDELAFAVHRHPDWVKKLLSLNYLSTKSKHLLDIGEISCTIGIEMAKLPIDRQDQLLSLHSELPAAECLELIREAVREFRGGKVRDRSQAKYADDPRTFRQFRKVKDEHLNKVEKATVLARYNAVSASDGWDVAFNWILSVDEHTLAERLARKERGDRLEAQRSQLRDLELSRRKQNEQ